MLILWVLSCVSIRILDHCSEFVIWLFLIGRLLACHACIAAVEVIYHHLHIIHYLWSRCAFITTTSFSAPWSSHAQLPLCCFILLVVKFMAKNLFDHKLHKPGFVGHSIDWWNLTSFRSFYDLFVKPLYFLIDVKLLQVINNANMIDVVPTRAPDGFTELNSIHILSCYIAHLDHEIRLVV